MNKIAAVITEFVDAVNRGDQEAALSLLASDVTIVEDLAPYRWHGPAAGAEWLRAMFENAQRNGITGISMNLRNTTRVEIDGPHAYAIVEGLLNYEGAVPGQSDGLLTFALVKHDGAWLISALVWTGPAAT